MGLYKTQNERKIIMWYLAIAVTFVVIGYKIGYMVRDLEAVKTESDRVKLQDTYTQAKREAYAQARKDLKKENK